MYPKRKRKNGISSEGREICSGAPVYAAPEASDKLNHGVGTSVLEYTLFLECASLSCK